jgi:hypothetical protein
MTPDFSKLDHFAVDCPLFKHEWWWYFYDETWGYSHGPFKTFAEATKNLNNYYRYLDNGVVTHGKS